MSVERDVVVKAYQLILGRLPESEQTVARHMRHANLMDLRKTLLTSNEFLGLLGDRREATVPLPIALPHSHIETDATDEIIEQCLQRIAAAWTQLGTDKPHFSVITNDVYMPNNVVSNLEKFWHSGEEEAIQIRDILQRHGFKHAADKTCVELGCGVGRVTFGLAKHFAKVHAYDVSAAHLTVAAERSQRIDWANKISWHQCSHSRLATFESCDIFYSRIVLQHNPPVIIARLIENALKAITIGGIAIFQVPTYRAGYSFKTKEWLNAEHGLDMEMHCIPQKNVFEIIARSGCKLLEIREDDAAPPISNTFIVTREENA